MASRTTGDAGAALLSVSGVRKTFDRTHALAGADFDLRAGEVHALVGANGAGKSTLSRIISGHLPPDEGTILYGGKPVRFASAREAIRDGITMVMQETSLAPDLSVVENVYLPELGMPGRLSWRALAQKAAALFHEFDPGHPLPLGAAVRDLSAGQRQLVEIAKALALDSRIIIFDEPTASFSPAEVERLFDVVRALAERGKGLVFVSHRLEEIFAITDRITVLREGKAVARSVATAEMTPSELVHLMVGRELSDIYARGAASSRPQHNPKARLVVEHLASAPRVKDVSFTVHDGEILGLAGLVGAGRSETAEAIFGLRRIEGGRVLLDGQPFRPRVPTDAVEAGIGFIAEDRRRQGLVPDFTVRENLMLAHLGRHRGIGLGYDRHEAAVRRLLADLALPERFLDAGILTLSGGMQQKVLLARWLLLKPRLLILDEPTRGVDIGTRSSIYAILRKIAGEGVALLVISSDFEEVVGICDRIVVMSDGADVTAIPSALADVGKLAMFAAPRSSAEETHAILEALHSAFGGIVYWIYVDRGRVFCFDSVGDDPAIDPGFGRGTFPPVETTAIRHALLERAADFVVEPDGERASMLVPLTGHRGHDLGRIGLTLPARGDLPGPENVRRLILAGTEARAMPPLRARAS